MSYPIQQQRCYDCIRSIGGCSWSRDFIPVKGWKATYKPKRSGLSDGSYRIEECPLYEKEPDNYKDRINRMIELGILIRLKLIE